MKHISEDQLKEITRRLADEFHPDAIYLFGSHAWGTPTEGSDVDLFVVVSESDEIPPKRASRALRCLRDMDFSKDVLVRTKDEVRKFQDIPASLVCHILKHGKQLYGQMYE